MNKLNQFIDDNYSKFSELSMSEVEHFSVNDIDSEIVQYLKTIERFDYRGICIYYVERENNIWVKKLEAKYYYSKAENTNNNPFATRGGLWNNEALAQNVKDDKLGTALSDPEIARGEAPASSIEIDQPSLVQQFHDKYPSAPWKPMPGVVRRQ